MANDGTPKQRLDELVANCLQKIEAATDRIDSEGCSDPDRTLADLEAGLDGLTKLVDVDLDPRGPVDDLNAILQCCAIRLLQHVQVPVIVKTSLDQDLPVLQLPGDQLVPALERALTLGITQAGFAGELTLVTRAEGSLVIIELIARPGVDGPARSLDLRSVTLAEYVAGLGGRVEMAFDQRQALHLAIELDSRGRVTP